MFRLALSFVALVSVLLGRLLVRPFELELTSVRALVSYLTDREAPARGRWGVGLTNLGVWGAVLVQLVPSVAGLAG